MSAMEHLVPEMMFSTEENPAHGISAVKALQLAAAEGQKIWTITQTNLNTALAAINLPSDIETDIRNSVNAGMEVTAHEAAVDFYGSSQVGYIVIDPETGAGGYLIGGGENGGVLIAIELALTGGAVVSTALVASLNFTQAAFHMVVVLSSAIALISRGAEIILHNTKDQDTACKVFQGAVANAIGGFIGGLKVLISLFSAVVANHISPFVVECL
jgi:hypothetical protein